MKSFPSRFLLVVGFIGQLAAQSAPAAVVDDLRCDLRYGGMDGYPLVTATLPFRGIRVPRAAANGAQTVYTDALIEYAMRAVPDARSPSKFAELRFRFVSTHAMKLDAQGKPMLAYHWRCLNTVLNVDGTTFPFTCPAMPDDPFNDPTGAWLKVGLDNDVPKFGIKEFRFEAMDTPIGPVILSCARLGTSG